MERAEGSEPVRLGMNLATGFSELTFLVYKTRRGRRHSGFSVFGGGGGMFCKVAENTELANTEPLYSWEKPKGRHLCVSDRIFISRSIHKLVVCVCVFLLKGILFNRRH